MLTENNVELIKMIRESNDPEQALLTATLVILDFLAQHESSQAPSAVCPAALG